MSHSIRLLFAVFSLSSIALAQAPAPEAAPLVRVMTRQGKTIAGELVSRDAANLKVRDLKTNVETQIDQKDVLKLQEPISLEELTRIAGLAAVTAWQVTRVSEKQAPVGKVARVSPTAIYVTLGSSHVAQGDELKVYRVKGEIKDPDTGEVLAKERPLVARVEVVEASDKLSKVKVIGDVEVMLEVGDEVETRAGQMKVAVCPVYYEDGTLTDVGAQLSEDVTTLLVQRGVSVVERSALDAVLGELLVQNTALFESKTAQNLGKLTGASVVVAGKIVPSGRTGKAYVRLIDVQSGEILQAASDSVSLANARVVASRTAAPKDSPQPAGNPVPEPLPAANGKRTSLNSRGLPRFLVTRANYRRDPSGGIKFAKREYILTRDGTFLNKDFTFEILVAMDNGDGIGFIGVGEAQTGQAYNEPMNSVNLRFHAPDNSGEVNLGKNGQNVTAMGTIRRAGTHLVRIQKEGTSVTFMVDVDNDGPSDDDFETTVPDIKAEASFLNSKNMYLFFGGGGRYIEVGLTENR
jgi:hypothetical protein